MQAFCRKGTRFEALTHEARARFGNRRQGSVKSCMLFTFYHQLKTPLFWEQDRTILSFTIIIANVLATLTEIEKEVNNTHSQDPTTFFFTFSQINYKHSKQNKPIT